MINYENNLGKTPEKDPGEKIEDTKEAQDSLSPDEILMMKEKEEDSPEKKMAA